MCTRCGFAGTSKIGIKAHLARILSRLKKENNYRLEKPQAEKKRGWTFVCKVIIRKYKIKQYMKIKYKEYGKHIANKVTGYLIYCYTN